MVQHRRQHSARPARGGRHDHSARSVLLRSGQRIGIDLSAAVQAVAITARLDIICRRLAFDPQSPGQNPFIRKAVLDRSAHRIPYRMQIIPYPHTLALLDILPIVTTCAIAPVEDLADMVHRIHIDMFDRRLVVHHRTAADTVCPPTVGNTACNQAFEKHSVCMLGQHLLRPPDDLDRRHRFQNIHNGTIRQVPASRCGQTAVQRNAESFGFGMPCGKSRSRQVRTHRMAARRSATYFI